MNYKLFLLSILSFPLLFLLFYQGADVVDSMRHWAEKARTFLRPTITCDGIIVFIRDGWTAERVRELLGEVLTSSSSGGTLDLDLDVHVIPMPDALSKMSSHYARAVLTRDRRKAVTEDDDVDVMPSSVAKLCRQHLPEVMEVYAAQAQHERASDARIDCVKKSG